MPKFLLKSYRYNKQYLLCGRMQNQLANPIAFLHTNSKQIDIEILDIIPLSTALENIIYIVINQVEEEPLKIKSCLMLMEKNN